MPAIAMPDLPWEGGCRCGAVRFRVDVTPLATMVCHCRGCQLMSGGAFSTSVMVPTPGFAVIAGETVIGGAPDARLRHNHCDACKSWLFTRFEPDMGFVNVRATMLDDATWFVPFVESQTAEALPWALTGARHSFARFPPMDRYQALIAEFAADPAP